MNQTMDERHPLSQYFYQVLDALPDHIFIFSENAEYLAVFGGDDNEAGYDCKPFIGKTLYDVTSASTAKKFHNYIRKTLASNKTLVVQYRFSNQHLLDLPEGICVPDELWFESIIKPLPIQDDGLKRVIWTARNVTLQHNLQAQLKRLSETDELTGILNRRAFMAKLVEQLQRYQRNPNDCCLLMLDIDKFKSINDILGHNAGDQTIKHITDICSNTIRKIDYIGRLGGEEFAILLSNTSLQQATHLAERLRQRISDSPCIVGQHHIAVTVSIGITHILNLDDTSETLLSRADKAMYHSKNQGRNQVSVFHETMQHGET